MGRTATLNQALIVALPLARLPLSPGVVAAGRDAHHPTQQADRNLLALCHCCVLPCDMDGFDTSNKHRMRVERD
jgi:hypothetical protein